MLWGSLVMHGCNRTLALALSAFVVVACASSPPRPSTQDLSTNPAHSPVHHGYFADVIAVASAMGGNNPNHSQRLLGAKRCPRSQPVATASQLLDNRPVAEGLRTTPCQRVAVSK